MKANELMIGDLFRVNRDRLCIKKETIVQVRGIDADDKLEKTGLVGAAHCRPLDKNQFDGGIWVDYLSPIPITPEILEKNGFERREDLAESIQDALPFIWENKKTESVVVGWRDSYDNGFRDENAEAWGEYWEINVDGIEARYEKTAKQLYVHELQHAIRLCGIEKEIEL